MSGVRRAAVIACCTLLFSPCVIFADTNGTAQVSAGDTAWMLVSSALVLFMTPGVAFFYGGLVRKKNVVTTMFQVFAVMLIVSVQWVLVGYSLAFGPDVHHVVGSLQWTLLRHVGVQPNSSYASTIPSVVFALFQMMFAVIAPALIVGGLAERVKFSSFLLFITLWATLVYDPLAHWVWGEGGWLRTLGVFDFAGGTVVHISSGVAGLVAAVYLGKRAEYGSDRIRAHSVPLVLLGTAMLWFGWFGFNAGSALQANGLAAMAFLTTNTAAAAASLCWMIVERLHTRRVTLVGACAGTVAGLVAITPAAGYVTPAASILIGCGSGVVGYIASTFMKVRMGYDDALDAFGGHGIGGTWGALATGLFASSASVQGVAGHLNQIAVQLLAVAVTWVFSGLGTFALIKVVDWTVGFRVSKEEEMIGLDNVLHNEAAYPETLSAEELPLVLDDIGVQRLTAVRR